jgi:ribosomal subunit interface protein
MEIIFKGRQTDVAEKFRDQAAAKLEKLEKLDQKAIRVDVEVSVERNPRQASQKERVELTIVSRGPVVRAEAAAEDRFAALDMALAKLDSRLRRALDRRKRHYLGRGLGRAANRRAAEQLVLPEDTELPGASVPATSAPTATTEGDIPSDSLVAIATEGNGPLVVRQKFHRSIPMPIDQALLEMELVGHDFFLFHDVDQDMPSVVYRRHGYQYGVIRLVEASVAHDGSDSSARAEVEAEVPASRRPNNSNGQLGSGAKNGAARRRRKASASRSS